MYSAYLISSLLHTGEVVVSGGVECELRRVDRPAGGSAAVADGFWVAGGGGGGTTRMAPAAVAPHTRRAAGSPRLAYRSAAPLCLSRRASGAII